VEYSKAPAVTRDRLYLDMMQQVLSNSSKVLIDQKSGASLLYLPLDKMLQIGGSPAATQELSPRAATPETAPQPEGTSRSREAFRSRDREQRQ
jgi:membrane protease subunit HflK